MITSRETKKKNPNCKITKRMIEATENAMRAAGIPRETRSVILKALKSSKLKGLPNMQISFRIKGDSNIYTWHYGSSTLTKCS